MFGEICSVFLFIPILFSGTQEVIQDIANHVLELDQNEYDNDIRELGLIRVGRRYDFNIYISNSYILNIPCSRNRDSERIRQSTGNWQRDPNMEWKRNILVPTPNKSILERASEIR